LLSITDLARAARGGAACPAGQAAAA
jgi:hypothetical protein